MHGFQNTLEPGDKFLKIIRELVKQANNAVHQLRKNDPDQPGKDENEQQDDRSDRKAPDELGPGLFPVQAGINCIFKKMQGPI